MEVLLSTGPTPSCFSNLPLPQVEQVEAERYAERHHMGFYEVSPLVNFNITESFQELCRMALRRNGMERLWRGRQVTTEHCTHI